MHRGKRGEIATTLTLVAIVIMTVGAFVGSRLAQENADIRSRAETPCVLTGNPVLLPKQSGKAGDAFCRVFASKTSPDLVCALIDEKTSARGDEILIAGQDPADWSGVWNGSIADVPLFYKDGQFINSSITTYKLVVWDYRDPGSIDNPASYCARTTDISGSDAANNFGSSQQQPTQAPTQPPQQPTQPSPTPPRTTSCQFFDAQDCSAACTTSCVATNAALTCWVCATPTPKLIKSVTPTKTPTKTPTPIPTKTAACYTDAQDCSAICSSCVYNATRLCWTCATPTPTPTKTVCEQQDGMCVPGSCTTLGDNYIQKNTSLGCNVKGSDFVCCVLNAPTPPDPFGHANVSVQSIGCPSNIVIQTWGSLTFALRETSPGKWEVVQVAGTNEKPQGIIAVCQ